MLEIWGEKIFMIAENVFDELFKPLSKIKNYPTNNGRRQYPDQHKNLSVEGSQGVHFKKSIRVKK